MTMPFFLSPSSEIAFPVPTLKTSRMKRIMTVAIVAPVTIRVSFVSVSPEGR